MITQKINHQYQRIIKSLDAINKGDARELTIVWVSLYTARIVYEDTTIHTIRAGQQESLDQLVAEYLEGFLRVLTSHRQNCLRNSTICPL